MTTLVATPKAEMGPVYRSIKGGLVSASTGYVWKSVSPSQIDAYRRCHLRWWWSKPGRKPSDKTRALAFGTCMHAVVEEYELTGRVPDANQHPLPTPRIAKAIKEAIADWWGRPLDHVDDRTVLAFYHEACPVALAGLKHLPRPEDIRPEDVEREMLIRLPELPVPVYGRIDLVEPEATYKRADGTTRPRPRVTDHKSTSNFKYLKTPDELYGNPQSIIYSMDLALRLQAEGRPDSPQAFRHIAYRAGRASPDSRTAETFYDCRQEVIDLFHESIVPDVVSMAADLHRQPIDVEPNLDACGDYGKCPHRGECAGIGLAVYGAMSDLHASIQADLFPSTPPVAPATPATTPSHTQETPTMNFASIMQQAATGGAAQAAGSTEQPKAQVQTQAPTTQAPAQAPANGPGNKTIESDNATVRFANGKPVEAAGKVPECALVISTAMGISLTDATTMVLPLLPETAVLAWRKTVSSDTAAAAGYGTTSGGAATAPRLRSTTVNPPDGTPDAVQGERDQGKGKKAADDSNRPRLLDGRIAATLKKPELVAEAQSMMAALSKLPDLEAVYLQRCSLMGASWYNRGPKVPLSDDLFRDVCLMVALLQDDSVDAWPVRDAVPGAPEPLDTRPLLQQVATRSAEQDAAVIAQHSAEMYESEDDDPVLARAKALLPEYITQAVDKARAVVELAERAVAAQQVIIRDAELTEREDDADDARAAMPGLEVKVKRARRVLDTAHEACEKALQDAIEFVQNEMEAEAAAEAARLAVDGSAEDTHAATLDVDLQTATENPLVQARRTGTQVTTQGPMLYIGCAPRATPCEYLEGWLAPYFDAAAKSGAVPHHYMLKGYQEGAKRVATHLEVLYKRGELILPQHMVADRRYVSTDAVLEVLVRFYPAQNVVDKLG